MRKKKSKEPETPVGGDTVSSQSDNIFKTIFGDVSESNPAVSSLFSDSNPFKRKTLESVESPEKVDSLGSDTVELKQRKRKDNEKSQNPSLGSIEEATESHKEKTVKTLENPNMGSLSGNVESSDFDAKILTGQDVKRKKRKRDEVEKEYEEKKYGSVAVAVAAEEEVVVGQKRKKAEDDGVVTFVPKEGFDDESKLLRTVFVGNLPIKVKKKVLIKEFSTFGEIESVRIRSVPLNDTKKPRKGAIMLKQINEKADSVHAYIVFKTEQSAEASLAHNMAVVAGNHIRVDRACPPRKKLKGENALLYDNKRTVFVGNLPFDVKDEEIYQLFCGINNLESSIEAVRVVRDPQFGVGKGIAYVLFKTREAANVVVRKRILKLRDRELRLSHARPDATPSKRKNPSSSGTNGTPAKKLALDSITPSTNGNRTNAKASLSYQGLRASKSGVEKKVHSKGTSGPLKMKVNAQKSEKPKERTTKRPAVAARKAKAKAHKDAGVSKQGGVKRKLDSLSPGSAHQKKKAKRFR
ncbi:RNA-binding protein 34-like [Durio zibethinus]|uniref:RNA-binding protein 34-like n=1 Tax=Durio zibethinus TaxID=66656 RepID=A0A6P5Y7M7_DURZI|nr:RNA-binding protein 34-like [Durio zibethinus]